MVRVFVDMVAGLFHYGVPRRRRRHDGGGPGNRQANHEPGGGQGDHAWWTDHRQRGTLLVTGAGEAAAMESGLCYQVVDLAQSKLYGPAPNL